ncbi:unnamed protein product [marine sediment metagenome]|uniref:Uncharacterized protein n=1 Tax=marine sediment metagenome TaxID=412755 RepID=X0ZR76_9ZZZZ
MVIREAGVLFRGFTLVCSSNLQIGKENVNTAAFDDDLRSGLLTAIITFAETAFSSSMVEYFEGKKFVIAFFKTKIQPGDSKGLELLISYAIFDNKKKIDKHVHKVIQPLLSQCISSFKSEFEGTNFTEVAQFNKFKPKLEKLFSF